MMTTWTKTNSGRYEATINGRTFVLDHNRKTRTRTVKAGTWEKHRRSRTMTWYDVVERRADGTWWNHTSVFEGQLTSPGSLAEAKALAARVAGE
jgi:hypothetical protein